MTHKSCFMLRHHWQTGLRHCLPTVVVPLLQGDVLADQATPDAGDTFQRHHIVLSMAACLPGYLNQIIWSV